MPGIGKVRKDIGANVRTFRKNAGLSQESLAEKADLHPVYISQVERGAKAGKQPERGICAVGHSFPESCASEAKAALPSIRRAGAAREPQFHKLKRLLEPGRLTGDSPDTRRTRAGHSGGITFAFPAAPPTSASPLNTIPAYGQSAAGTRVLNGRGRLY